MACLYINTKDPSTAVGMTNKKMKNKIKAVIFDMDGVIVDGETIQNKSWEKVLEEYGIKPIYNENGLIHLVGPVDNASYLYVMNKHHLNDDIEIVRKKRRDYYSKLIKEKLDLLPGSLELLQKLKKANVRIALASNRIIEHVSVMIENLGVKDFFEVIVTKNTNNINNKPKPAPDIYLQAAKELNLKPDECVALEDTDVGVISAHSAGMKVIAIPTKFTHHQDFSKADKIVNNLSEIDISLLNSL